MAVASAFKRVIQDSLTGMLGRRLEKRGLVQSAPTYALLEVKSNQYRNLALQIESLSSQFDYVKIVAHSSELPDIKQKNVELFVSNTTIQTRWNLLSTCHDGFVFPISLEKPVAKDHVQHLKQHLFVVGPGAAVGLLNLARTESDEDSRHREIDLVPVPALDLDYSVFDQRYWSLSESKLGQENEESLSQEAKARGFALFACHSAEVPTRPTKLRKLDITRADLIENLLDAPRLARTLDAERVLELARVWNSFGLKKITELSGGVEKSLKKLLAKGIEDETQVSTLTKILLGKSTKRVSEVMQA